ncbi:Uncharacterised protein [Mycobacteroides abscessus subsp. abscessus]|nr:Uncharacterised protein [Mycobacteroides abscessus subsp. abscessus]
MISTESTSATTVITPRTADSTPYREKTGPFSDAEASLLTGLTLVTRATMDG